MKGTAGVLCIVLAVIFIGIGVYLLPATMWRNIAVGALIIGILLLVVGIFLLRKQKHE